MLRYPAGAAGPAALPSGPAARHPRPRDTRSSPAHHELLAEVRLHDPGSSATSRGRPSAIFSPWSRTTTRSTTRIRVAMMCSTHTIVIWSSPRIRRSISTAPAISAASRPPRLSSASRSFGPVASARRARALSPPAPRSAVDAPSSVGRPTSRRMSRARALPRPPCCGGTPRSGRQPRRSPGSTASGMGGSGTCARRPGGRSRRREPGDLRPLEADRPTRRLKRSGDAVEHRRLAGAVRADQSEDLPLGDLEGHVVQRGEPPEALDEPGHRQERRHRRASPAGPTARAPRPRPGVDDGRGPGDPRPNDQRAANGEDAGRSTGGLFIAMTLGHTCWKRPSTIWYTAAMARSFCPRIGCPSPWNFTP